jgi:hypothetical protein
VERQPLRLGSHGHLHAFIGSTATPNTVAFNVNGGSRTMANETTSAPNNFTHSGYNFAGWNTAANGVGGTSYADGASYPFNASTTLYAQRTVAPRRPTPNRRIRCLLAGN